MIKFPLVICAMAVLVPIVLAQQSHISGKADPLSTPEALAGKQVFGERCGMCHGAEARGGEGPSLVDSGLVRHDEHGNLIIPLLHQGRVDKGMPAFAFLDDKQVASLVAFLHAAVTAADNRGAGGPASGYSGKQFMTGDAAAGEVFFAKNCSSCHSVSGDLAGIAQKLSPLELERGILYPPSKGRTGKVQLASGEDYQGQIVHLDSFFVAITDTHGVYHSWPMKSGVRVNLDDPLRGHRELLPRYHDKDIHDVFTYLETLH